MSVHTAVSLKPNRTLSAVSGCHGTGDTALLGQWIAERRRPSSFEPLFGAAGLRLNRVIPTPSPTSIAEGMAA